MQRHRLKFVAAFVLAVAAIACDKYPSLPGDPLAFNRIRLEITNPGDTIYVRRFGACNVYDSAIVAGGALDQVSETLLVRVGQPATITASFVDMNNNADPLTMGGTHKFVIVGERSKVGTLTWTPTTDYAGTLTGSAVTNTGTLPQNASNQPNDSASLRVGVVDKSTGDTVYGHTCPVRVTVRP